MTAPLYQQALQVGVTNLRHDLDLSTEQLSGLLQLTAHDF